MLQGNVPSIPSEPGAQLRYDNLWELQLPGSSSGYFIKAWLFAGGA